MKKKYLLVATRVKVHINVFHLPTLKMMKSKGYEVHVASHNDYSKPLDIPYCDNFFEVPFERMPFHTNNFKSLQILIELLRKENYDIIHCHTPVGSIIARLAAKKSGTNAKIVYTAHGFHFFKESSLLNWILYYPIEKIFSKFTTDLITINTEDFELAQKKFDSIRTHYVPGVGIDLKKYNQNFDSDLNELRKEIGISKKDIVLLSVGELNSNKNHQIVLESLSMMKDKKFKYLVCGEGPQYEELIKKIDKKGLSENVKLLGFREDINKILQISNIFVFPSKREGLPVSVMEAMATGLPVIASDIRGNNDLITQGDGGYLYPVNDVESLSLYLEKTISDASLRRKMGNYNLNKIKNYSEEKILQMLTDIYEA